MRTKALFQSIEPTFKGATGDLKLGKANAWEARHAQLVLDYIAGMTDRYAVAEHRRLFDETPELHLSPPEATRLSIAN
jgi:dGTP triphosphohydrolase